jgi:capsular polysaccharide transport system permease protein
MSKKSKTVSKVASVNLQELRTTDVETKRWSAQKWRRFLIWATFVPFVVFPIALAAIYYFSYATDRYAVEFKFAIRSPNSSSPNDLLGMVTGVSSVGSTVVDSYIVSDFIESRDLIDRLEQRFDLRSLYSGENADYLMRYDGSVFKEDFVKYMQRMISVYYDSSSQIMTVEVQAFTPENAKAVAEGILYLSGQLVNEISERARLDTVRSAEFEVERAEQLLRDHRTSIASFRELEQDIDPTRSVEAQQLLLGRVLGALTDAKTRVASLREFLSEDAPSIKILESQINSLEIQVTAIRARIGGGAGDMDGNLQTLTARVGAYEELTVDLEFFQRAYVSSLVSLEAARLEADRQQRYLASFVVPSLPEKSLYPKRGLNMAMVAALSFMLWGISVMFAYIIREHLT